jgi:hypothetical protein
MRTASSALPPTMGCGKGPTRRTIQAGLALESDIDRGESLEGITCRQRSSIEAEGRSSRGRE